MPTLNWIGKDKVVNHHLDVPFCTLEKQYTYASEGRDDGGNMIIHGDNLYALKALLPQFEGKVKCIYIDPPYNTGNEGWVYNDNVNDPKIKKWLGEVVGREGEDLSRHDKWLCMMYPRLKLLHRLLAENGVIFISIDDTGRAARVLQGANRRRKDAVGVRVHPAYLCRHGHDEGPGGRVAGAVHGDSGADHPGSAQPRSSLSPADQF